MREAGIYVRISSDDEGTGLGVKRQEIDCRTEAEARGWTVATVYCDNDVSATRTKVRPQYSRMLGDVQRGHITALVVWDVDRLTRTPRELEDVIDLADRHGLALASVGGEIDLSTPQGRLTARLKGSVARHETEQQSRRLRRKLQEKAETGARHGFAPYGWQATTDGPDQLNPEQERVIKETAKRLLMGESLRSVVTGLNADGHRPPRGDRWSSTQLRQIMVRERNAGRRIHRGRVVGLGNWPPALDEDTHDRVVALLVDPDRRTNRGATRRHLLSGLITCGCCGSTDVVVNVGRRSRGKLQAPAYVCRACTRIRRKEEDVDRTVERVILARLQEPDVVARMSGDPEEARDAKRKIEALGARLELAADEFAAGTITIDQLKRITASLSAQIESARARVRDSMPHGGVLDFVGVPPGVAASRWGASSMDVRRSIIETYCSITLLPRGSGRSFAEDSVQIKWRG